MLSDINKFMDSPYVQIRFGKWTIDDDAPEELKKEFYVFLKLLERQGGK